MTIDCLKSQMNFSIDRGKRVRYSVVYGIVVAADGSDGAAADAIAVLVVAVHIRCEHLAVHTSAQGRHILD